jgi:hypothetical protein
VRHGLFALVLALGLPAAASALTVEGSWWLGGEALSEPGLAVRTSRDGGAFDLDLADGGAARFRLFRIWTDERDLGADDRVARVLSAGFALPALGAGGSIAGAVRGREALWVQWGAIDWRAPLEVAVGGGTLSIRLTDRTFNPGVLALGRGRAGGADVFARVSFAAGRSAAAPVPLPAGLPLALTGLGLLALVRRCAGRG